MTNGLNTGSSSLKGLGESTDGISSRSISGIGNFRFGVVDGSGDRVGGVLDFGLCVVVGGLSIRLGAVVGVLCVRLGGVVLSSDKKGSETVR